MQEVIMDIPDLTETETENNLLKNLQDGKMDNDNNSEDSGKEEEQADQYEQKSDSDMVEEEKCGHYYPGADGIVPSENISRVVVLGDLHGDLAFTLNCLHVAGVIDKQNGDFVRDNKGDIEWTDNPQYQNTVVVQVGDQVDRCRPTDTRCDNPNTTPNDEANDVKILHLMTKLHKKAEEKGGAVFSLLGNHELMNVEGNMEYVSYLGLKQFAQDGDDNMANWKTARRDAFKPGSKHARHMACTRAAALIVGNLLFVHAGLIVETVRELNLRSRNDIKKLNKKVREWLLGKSQNDEYVRQVIAGTKKSLFWTRYLGNITPGVSPEGYMCNEHLNPALEILSVGHMIIGHTPQFISNSINKRGDKSQTDGINKTCGNKLWRVDVGGSKAFSEFSPNGPDRDPQVLEITMANGVATDFRVIRR